MDAGLHHRSRLGAATAGRWIAPVIAEGDRDDRLRSHAILSQTYLTDATNLTDT
jgi:hypothetical protein